MDDELWLDLASEETVALNLNAQDKASAIEELAELLLRAGKLSSKAKYVEDVLEREAHVPTSVGRGVAIPHARSSAVLETAVAVGRVKGLHWAEDDEQPVRMVFLLAVPIDNPTSEYIGMLASLASALLNDGFCGGVMSATSKAQIVEYMREYNICAKDAKEENAQ